MNEVDVQLAILPWGWKSVKILLEGLAVVEWKTATSAPTIDACILMVIQLGILSWMQILVLISWTRVCGPKDSPGGNTLDSASKPFGRERMGCC